MVLPRDVKVQSSFKIDQKFKGRLSYLERTYLKNKQTNVGNSGVRRDPGVTDREGK